MKLIDIQNLFIEEAIKADPRGKDAVALDLKKRNENYEQLNDEQKKNFDADSLKNPYYDSRILHGDPNTQVQNVLVGIDIETSEILLAKALKDGGRKIDLIIAHHPEGYAYATFPDIGFMQADILHRFGAPINVAEKIVSKKRKEVAESIAPQNTQRVSDAAKLVDIPFMTAHTVADNQVANFLQKEIEALNPQYLKEIICLINKQPEYRHASKNGHPPRILLGDENSRCGKVFVDMTGGYEGPVEMFEELKSAGIGTLVCMHLGKKAVESAEKNNLNIVLAGHISSDNLGLNVLFDKLESKFGKIEFIECSGFRRFRR
jgi:putative NIF3 family GTP cyclohydrolase 1 type 2